MGEKLGVKESSEAWDTWETRARAMEEEGLSQDTFGR